MLLLISMIEIITISKVSNSIIVISLTPVSEGRIEPPTVMQHPGSFAYPHGCLVFIISRMLGFVKL